MRVAVTVRWGFPSYAVCALLLCWAQCCPPARAQETVRGRTQNPHGKLTLQCESCHTTTAWKPIRKQPEFVHDRQTKFPLLGRHQDVACIRCHASLNFSKAPTQCSECHADLHRRQFGANCENCHTVRGWGVQISEIRQHNNRFPLIGAHAVAVCDDCHHGAAAGTYTGLSTACASCHIGDYRNAAPLNHVTAKLPLTCENCHGMNSWGGARFDHANVTGFALQGAHAALECAQCHSSGFTGASTQCAGCHMTDFTSATNPNHVSGKFPTTCASCHTLIAWTGAKFNHTTTGFALAGAHTSLQCSQCHVNNNYSLTSGTCWNCHQTDYNGATNPAHRAANFPQDCTVCHGSSAVNWTGATFNHTTTGFALTGAHTSLQCSQCHVNNNYSLTSGACWNCHQTDYNTANSPPHASAGFPQDCTGCHTTTAWTGASFNHAATGFTLTGAHTSLQCSQCHVNSNYSLTSGACWNCHQTDYNGTNSPPHAAAGFPQDCSVCHSTTNWSGATFAHPSTPLALTGAHATMLTNNQCAQCHVGNNYVSTPSDCWSCHQVDYNGTTNPGHAGAGFAHTCSDCHTFINWDGATYTAHDSAYFPIYSGNHRGRWTTCGDCHTDVRNYAVFTCIACHQHSNQAQVTSSHSGVRNFVYNGTSCYTCHPRGSGG